MGKSALAKRIQYITYVLKEDGDEVHRSEHAMDWPSLYSHELRIMKSRLKHKKIALILKRKKT